MDARELIHDIKRISNYLLPLLDKEVITKDDLFDLNKFIYCFNVELDKESYYDEKKYYDNISDEFLETIANEGLEEFKEMLILFNTFRQKIVCQKNLDDTSYLDYQKNREIYFGEKIDKDNTIYLYEKVKIPTKTVFIHYIYHSNKGIFNLKGFKFKTIFERFDTISICEMLNLDFFGIFNVPNFNKDKFNYKVSYSSSNMLRSETGLHILNNKGYPIDEIEPIITSPKLLINKQYEFIQEGFSGCSHLNFSQIIIKFQKIMDSINNNKSILFKKAFEKNFIEIFKYDKDYKFDNYLRNYFSKFIDFTKEIQPLFYEILEEKDLRIRYLEDRLEEKLEFERKEKEKEIIEKYEEQIKNFVDEIKILIKNNLDYRELYAKQEEQIYKLEEEIKFLKKYIIDLDYEF